MTPTPFAGVVYTDPGKLLRAVFEVIPPGALGREYSPGRPGRAEQPGVGDQVRVMEIFREVQRARRDAEPAEPWPAVGVNGTNHARTD